MSRTKKKAYTKAKAIDKSCRNHGSCPWCYGNRMYKHLKKLNNEECKENNTREHSKSST
jgi:uncharacterized protein (DUF983 family)